MSEMLNKDGFLTYKNRPLVRQKDTIYYGSMGDPYVVFMQILSKDPETDLPAKLRVQLMSTDPNVPITESVVKKADRAGLYDALDTADVWLTKALD